MSTTRLHDHGFGERCARTCPRNTQRLHEQQMAQAGALARRARRGVRLFWLTFFGLVVVTAAAAAAAGLWSR